MIKNIQMTMWHNLIRFTLLLYCVAATGCVGMRSAQKAQYDPANDLHIVQMTSNFLPSDPDDPGAIALNARKETEKAGNTKCFLVLEMTSLRRNQLSIQTGERLELRLEGKQHLLEPAGSGTALDNVRSALFFKIDPELIRKIGDTQHCEIKIRNRGKPVIKLLSPSNIEAFKLFAEINLPKKN